MSTEALSVEWHVASEPELAFADELMTLFYRPAVSGVTRCPSRGNVNAQSLPWSLSIGVVLSSAMPKEYGLARDLESFIAVILRDGFECCNLAVVYSCVRVCVAFSFYFSLHSH